MVDEIMVKDGKVYVPDDVRELVMKEYHDSPLSGVMYNVGAVRLCPKGDPKGLGCSTPKRKRAFDNLVIQKRTGSDLCTTRWIGIE